jgi:putative ABC transport system permease protein
MLKSYLKTALRSLLKNKTFSLINISGLALGTSCCLYILLYVQDQYSYDKHQKDAQNIYRVTTTAVLTGDKHNMATASPPVAPALKRGFPEVEQFTRLYSSDMFGNNRNMLKYKDKLLDENGLVFVDSTFFDVLSYHFVYGRGTRDILAEPYSIVLSKPTAVKLFGNGDPVGKVITIDNNYGKHDYKVNGVVDESLGKTHVKANIFVTMRSGGFGQYLINNSQWAGNNIMCSYIKLRPGADPVALEKKLPGFLNKYGAQDLKALCMTKALYLQPIASAHIAPGY